MIGFRYHLVSITAVFLALGLGILIGSSVVSDTVESSLQEDVTQARSARDQARAERNTISGERDTLVERLNEEIAPLALDDRLAGEPVVLVVDGDEPEWQDHVTGALETAGAQLSGVIGLTAKWDLAGADDQDDLARAMNDAVGAFEAGGDPAAAALTALGDAFVSTDGVTLIGSLEGAGFLTVRGRPDDDVWPPPSSLVVFLSPARSPARSPAAEPTTSAVPFITTVSAATPTLVLTDSDEGESGVSEIRELRGDQSLSDLLSTFDAATAETDPGGIGVAAALLAATEGRGGDFGTSGDRFVAPPSSED